MNIREFEIGKKYVRTKPIITKVYEFMAGKEVERVNRSFMNFEITIHKITNGCFYYSDRISKDKINFASIYEYDDGGWEEFIGDTL